MRTAGSKRQATCHCAWLAALLWWLAGLWSWGLPLVVVVAALLETHATMHSYTRGLQIACPPVKGTLLEMAIPLRKNEFS